MKARCNDDGSYEGALEIITPSTLPNQEAYCWNGAVVFSTVSPAEIPDHLRVEPLPFDPPDLGSDVLVFVNDAYLNIPRDPDYGVTIDYAHPYISRVTGRTLIPVRHFTQALGGTVSWDEPTRKVELALLNRAVVMHIDQPVATVSGKQYPLDQPPVIHGGRTLVPLRFIMEAFGASVRYVQRNDEVPIVVVTLEGVSCVNLTYCDPDFGPAMVGVTAQ